MLNKLGFMLNKLRTEMGLSVEDLAKKLDVGVSTIYDWERGDKEPRVEKRGDICRFFKITESELFAGNLNSDELSPDKMSGDSQVMMSAVDSESGRTPGKRSSKKQIKVVSFIDSEEAPVTDNAMAPVARRGQSIIYAKKAQLEDGDLAYVKLKDGTETFRQYATNPADESIILTAINPSASETPRVIKPDEIVFCHKVVGIRFSK